MLSSKHTKKLSLDAEVFTRGVEDIVTREELARLLARGTPLRIKHGIDATSPDLHIGHAASLWKMRALQEAGHKAIILLGDVTTLIGDPTGRTSSRPVLSPADIRKNARAIERQLSMVLLTNPEVFELRKSSEWYRRMRAPDLIRLLSMVTYARLIERDMFRERMRQGSEIFMHELIYPILQGYDSVMLEDDLTIIGSDQLFNEHMGRFLQERHGKPAQVLVTLRILPGLDGGVKMSKSLGNHIALGDPPREKFGKAMRLIDATIIPYLETYTDVSIEEVKKVEQELARGKNPMEAKLFFAEQLVRRYHGAAMAVRERQWFLDTFSRGKTPEDIPEKSVHPGAWDVGALLVAVGLASSRSEARRLVLQGAVTFDGAVAQDPTVRVVVREGMVARAGRRRFARVRVLSSRSREKRNNQVVS